MLLKQKEKQLAIKLRREGKTYSEILKVVPVAKSTLSLWLREVGLSKSQKQKLTAKKRAAQKRGGAARRRQRIELTERIFKESKAKVGVLSSRERLLISAALYWGEGAKEKPHRTSQGIDFGNTDPEMIKFFVEWLRECMDIKIKDFYFSLYIHENHKERLADVVSFWERSLGLKKLNIKYVYYKKHKPKTKRKNISEEYNGTLRVRVRNSVQLQRKISGLIYGITNASCRIV